MSKYINFENDIEYTKLKEVATAIKNGKVVVFPTETVYGIGTNGLDEKAIEKLYKLKKRPKNKPISLLVNNIDMINDIAEDITELEYKLINKFMPGPLTIILKKKNKIPDILTANSSTVGIRIPENEIADITFEGDIKSDLKNFKISNQGGIIAFRYSNNEIAQYSSDEEQINHNELLKKANIQEDLLKAELQFDLIMQLNEGKIYKTNIYLQMPVENIVEQGTTSREITDTSNFIFKRINS